MPRGRRRRQIKGNSRAGTSGIASARVVSNIHAALTELRSQRGGIDHQIGALESALSALGGGAGRPRVANGRARRRGAAPRKGSLKDYISRVLSSGGIMAVKDVTTGVLKAGFRTKNKTLAKSVGIALSQMPNVNKVGRGQFKRT